MFSAAHAAPQTTLTTITTKIESTGKSEAKIESLLEEGLRHFAEHSKKYPLFDGINFPEDDFEKAIECFSKLTDLAKAFEQFPHDTLFEIYHRLQSRDKILHNKLLRKFLPSSSKPLDVVFAELLIKAAELGSAQAQYILGRSFFFRNDLTSKRPFAEVETNKIIGIAWLEKAAAQNNTAAIFLLGQYYEKYAPSLQLLKSLEFYEKAAAHGHAEAKTCLEPYAMPSGEKLAVYHKGIEMIEACLAKPTLVEAEVAAIIKHFKLGETYESKYESHYEHAFSVYFSAKKHPLLVRFEKTAAEFIVKAATLNSPSALFCLSKALAQGFDLIKASSFCERQKERNIEEDLKRVGEGYHKAAELGHADAQFEVASSYLKTNRDLAEHWARRAAEQNHGGAQCLLGNLYDPVSGPYSRRAEEKTFKENSFASSAWWLLAVKNNVVSANLPLVLRFVNGRGLVKSIDGAMAALCGALLEEKVGEGLDHYGHTNEFDQIMHWIQEELTAIRSPLSFSQAGFLFLGSVALKLMEERSAAIEDIPKQSIYLGAAPLNPYPSRIATCKERMISGLRLLFREEREIFDTYVRQFGAECFTKILEHFPEDKDKIIETAKRTDPLPAIENYANCIGKLLMNLYIFYAKPESAEAMQAHHLIELINPYFDLLNQPIHTVNIPLEFAKVATLLEKESRRLSSSRYSRTLFAGKLMEVSAVIAELDRAINTIKCLEVNASRAVSEFKR